MVPYIRDVCKRVNEEEDERYKRYLKAGEDYSRIHEEMEHAAARLGLSPVQLKGRVLGLVSGTLPCGTWWITCTRRVPGLTYYWLQPVTATAGDRLSLMLTQANALVITGGW